MTERKVKDGERIYLELVACIAVSLMRNGVNQEKAVVISHDTGNSLCQRWGGGTIYLPKRHLNSITTRNIEIFSDFNQGATYADLAQKHKLTERQIYEIIKKARRRQREEAKRLNKV
ncbi:MAG TPA: Mor transcription activator family protein [Geobacteraceae bacterium]